MKRINVGATLFWLFVVMVCMFFIGFIVGRQTAPETLIIIKDLAPVQLP